MSPSRLFLIFPGFLYLPFSTMIKYIKGDLFQHRSANFTVLAHACNPFGLWGGGIAAQFKKKYPVSYKSYARFCEEHGPDLLGKTLLIPPESGNSQYIACLFTSDFQNGPNDILEHTRKSMLDLIEQLKLLENLETENGRLVVNMPKINLGIFNVRWEDTEAVLEELDLHINVYCL